MLATSSKKLSNSLPQTIAKDSLNVFVSPKGSCFFIQLCGIGQASVWKLRDSKPHSKDISAKPTQHQNEAKVEQPVNK